MKEGIDMIDSFNDVLKARRSTREYTEEGVSKEDMQQIVEAGTLAPSGMGKKELMFVGLTNEYAKEYCRSRGCKLIEPRFFSLYGPKNKFGMDRYYGAKHIILVSRNKEIESLYLLDVGAAMENMLLKATNLGLQSCWIHAAKDLAENKDFSKFQEKLGLDSKYEVLESIAIGHGEKTIDKEVDNSRVKVF